MCIKDDQRVKCTYVLYIMLYSKYINMNIYGTYIGKYTVCMYSIFYEATNARSIALKFLNISSVIECNLMVRIEHNVRY